MSNISSYGGISGLASGMNTQDIVEQMLGNTQAKIDRQNALKQQNVWRQQIYRDMLSSITAFQNKYFSFSSPTTNLLSHSLYNNMLATASSDAIKVTGSSSATTGSLSIDKVTQLATNTKQQSSVDVTGEVNGNVNIKSLEKKVTINVDGTSREVNVTGNTKTEIADNLNKELEKAFGKDVVTASVSGGKLTIKAKDDTKTVKVEGGTLLGTSLLGVSIGQEGKGKIESTINTEKNTVNLVMSLDNTEKTIAIDVSNIKDEKSLVDEINVKLKNAFGSAVNAKFDNSTKQITFETLKTDGTLDDSRRLVIGGDRAILDTLGIDDGASNKINFNTKLKDANFKTKIQGNSYEFKINGVSISGNTDETIGDLVNKINGSGAGVRVTYSSFSDKFTVETSAYGAGAGIEMSQEKGNVLSALFGISSGGGAESRALNTNSLTGANNFDLDKFKNGGEFSFKVNGEEVKVKIAKDKKGYTADSFIAELNKELSKKSLGISFSVDKTNNKINMKNSKGHNVEFTSNDLSTAMGFKNGASTKATSTTTLKDLGLDKGTITVGSTDIDLSTINTVDDLVKEIDKNLKSSGGSASFDANSGNIKINGGNTEVSITAKTGDVDGENAMKTLFGSASIDFNKAVAGSTQKVESNTITINGNSGNVQDSTTLSDAKLDKGTINFMGTNIDLSKVKGANNGTATLGDLIKELDKVAKGVDKNASVKLDNGKISITGVNGNIKGIDADGKTVMNTLFGTDSKNISSNGLTLLQAGQNASFEMNGQVYERNSNVIEIDGITVEFLKTSAEKINITTTRDNDKVVDAVKSFVEDYNKLIEDLHKVIGQEPNYKKYPPLTDEQRKEMSESEIKLWEEKAKEGLIRNDSAVSSLLGQMRSILYEKPDGAKFSLFDLGITTGSWKDNGKLVMEDPPTKLLKALETNPQEIQKLFTDATDGIAVKIKGVLDNATKGGRPNSLVDIAGNVGSSNASNMLGRQIDSYERTLSSLKRKYKLEESRYWKQFNAMEKAVAAMNQQSAFLMQQMGG